MLRFRSLPLAVVVSAVALCLWHAPARCDSFLRRTGDQFTLDGVVYKMKGSNYYPASAPWSAWFNGWNWNEITTDINRLHDLGINCVRLNLPYSAGSWGGGNVNASHLDKLERLVEYLRYKGMKANITLFDWETSFPTAGTSTETQHKAYVTAIVNRLKNNPGVFVWDVKNEPDHPDNLGDANGDGVKEDDWDLTPTNKTKIVSWLSRMCATVKAADTNHMVSAGIRWYSNEKDVNSFVDVAIFHSYWNNIGTVEIPMVKGYTAGSPKPILVQEFGWPSHPKPCWRGTFWQNDFTEADQLSFYQTHLQAFAQHNIGGCIQWQATDLKAYVSLPNNDKDVSFENYFGLWRLGGALKPAGEYYRDNWPAAFFPYSDSTVPVAPTNVGATGLDRAVSVTFTHSASADCAGVVIRYSTAGYPTSPTSGSPFATIPGEGKSSGTTSLSGLQVSTKYYLSFFAYDYAGNYSARATATATTAYQPINLLSGGSMDAFTNGVANGWTPYECYPSGSAGPISFAADTSESSTGGVSQSISNFGSSALSSMPGSFAQAGVMQSVAATPGKTYLLVGSEFLTAPTSGAYYFRTFGVNPYGGIEPGTPAAANAGGAVWMGPGELLWNTSPGGSNNGGLMYRCVSAVTAASGSVSCWAGLGISLVDGRSPSDKINYDGLILHEMDNPLNASLANGNMEGAVIDCNDADIHLPSGWSPVGGGYGRFVGWDINTDPTYSHSGGKSAMFTCYPGKCEQGLMQRLVAYPGETLSASVYVRGVSSNALSTSASIGIDPTGGTDIFGASVVWTAVNVANSGSWLPLSVTTIAQGYSATVFIRASSGATTAGYHTVFADDASFSATMNTTSPALVRALPDGRAASLAGCVVTAKFSGYFYVEDPNRTSGMKVSSATVVQLGQKVDVSGATSTVSGERQITTGAVSIRTGTYPIPVALGIPINRLGGSAPNNTGLLVTSWGTVAGSTSTHFTIVDSAGVSVKVYSTLTPAIGRFATVTGISSCEIPSGGTTPMSVIRTRGTSDVRLYN